MIKTNRCKFTGCNHKELESPEEVDMGYCNRHIKQTWDRDYFVLSCWACGSLLETLSKYTTIKGAIIKDDYIFAKACPECSSASLKNLQYVTITEEKSPSHFVNDGGLLVTIDENNNEHIVSS